MINGTEVLESTRYYIHTDHLGSYCAITNATKQVKQRNYFDPWGNFKWLYKSRDGGFDIGESNPQTDSLEMQERATLNFALTNRGFTGHEHYPYFKIINMNGRLYDPIIARFFSPDKYVANSAFTQDFNRYTYARNNPLMYVDPDGQFLITFLVNAIIGWSKGENGWKAGGNAIANQFKIIGGLFTTDKNRTGGGQFWEFISRFTWQLPQTIIGHTYSQFANTAGQIDKVNYKAGATVMSGNFWGTGSAVTIGNYIHGNHNLEPKFDNWLFQHEYGHYLQSQAVGPLYFQRYALPSLCSGGAFKGGYHDYHPVEQVANARALKYFNKHIDGFADNGDWKFWANPIIGYNESLPFNDSKNQLALKYARLQPAWYDWVLGPEIILSGFAINTPVLNSQKRYHNKLDLMKADGLDIDDWLYYFKW
jgi:RHS repeat-associated protein